MGRKLVYSLVAVAGFAAHVEAATKWFKSKPGNGFPTKVQYYHASPSQSLNYDAAVNYCKGLNVGAELWCPSSYTEAFIVFGNSAYDDHKSLVDGTKKIEDLSELATTRSDTFVGIKRTGSNNHRGTNSQGLHEDYKCTNPLPDTKWKFNQWKGQQQGPWEVSQPVHQKGMDCVTMGQFFSVKWSSALCKPNAMTARAATKDTSLFRAQKEAVKVTANTFYGAKAICVTGYDILEDAAVSLDEAVAKKVRAKFNEIRKAVLKMLLVLAVMTLFMGSFGFCCCYCCYCYCCCCKCCGGSKAKNNATPPPAAVIVQAAAPPAPKPVARAPAPVAAPPPPQPMYAPPAPQPMYAPPPPQPMYAAPPQPMYAPQPMMQPMGGMGGMGGINLNISNNNTNTNSN